MEIRGRALRLLVAACFAVVCVALGPIAQADTLTGIVASVADGDSICVRVPKSDAKRVAPQARQCFVPPEDAASDVQFDVRLQAIDAPEGHRDQPYWRASRRSLERLVLGKTVSIQFENLDPRNRIVGRVFLADRDIGLEQIKSGMAWHYKDYEKEQTPAARKLYNDAESDARRERVGLWKSANPIPPWEWRQKQQGFAVSAPPGAVLGNRNSRIYHWLGCPYYDKISPKNRVEFPSAAAAEAAGYRPARNCN